MYDPLGVVFGNDDFRERRRLTSSLCLRSPRLLAAIIRASQRTRLGGLVTPQTHGPASDSALSAGRREFADGCRFFDHYKGYLDMHRLTGLKVLDLGCGYGGRTLFYAAKCAAAHVVGIEPFPQLVDRCEQLRQEFNCENAEFRIGRAERMPFADGTFDAVLSFDVLEHVDDPALSFREIRRVLKSTGFAWVVFPTYLGARASHLDFITRVPALHRLFDPATIVSVVNAEVSRSHGKYPVGKLPSPRLSTLGHLTRPNLNGLTRREALHLITAAALDVRFERISPFVRATDPIPAARPLNWLLEKWQSLTQLPELLIGSLAYELVPRPD
jgi:SAM-dependent methyltransferase